MAFINELIQRYVEQGVGAFGTTIFGSTAARLPTAAGSKFLTLVDSAGLADEETVDGKTYERPRVQVVARADDYESALALARLAYTASRLDNRFLGTTWVRRLRPVQPPFDMGPDSNGRARCGFTVQAWKRPS